MKRIITLVLCYFSILICVQAQDAFTGKWKIELIGSAEEWFFAHDASSSSITVSGSSIGQKLIIDNQKKTIVIPALNMIADSFDYKQNEDGTIDLFVSGSFNINLIESLTQSISTEDAPNSVSVDAYQKLITEIENAMHRIPIIRLRKISDGQT